jgi:hypothetical protein
LNGEPARASESLSGKFVFVVVISGESAERGGRVEKAI